MTTNRYERKVESAAIARRARLSGSLLPVSMRVALGSGSGGQIVAMMQASKPWHRYDSAARFRVTHCFAAGRRSLRQSKISSVHVVITGVLIYWTVPSSPFGQGRLLAWRRLDSSVARSIHWSTSVFMAS